MGAVKNMIKGFVFTAIYVVTTIILPIYLFSWIRTFASQDLGISLEFTQQDYENVVFWITSLGILICGCAFFTHSSPKKSIRRASFALLQVLVNCIYVYAYKFSGAIDITFVMEDLAYFALDLSEMLLVYLGVYFLTIVLRVYDLIDFIINKEEIREERMKA